MLKLSILIAARDDAQLEASLVSVLQNRPADCEIVVVHEEGYDDPYKLAGEVRFYLVPQGTDELTRFNHGLAECLAPVVHVLRCGAEVADGWTTAALAHFADPRIAAVAPLLVAHGGQRIEAAGIDYRPGGARQARHHAAPAASFSAAAGPILGPALCGAFYRLSAVRQVGGALCPALGVELADVDLALRLAQAGYQARFEPGSRVIAAPATRRGSPLSDAWLAERLFWRHSRHFGSRRSLVSHARLLGVESAASLVRPLRAGRILGRIAGMMERAIRGVGDAARVETFEPHAPQERTGLHVRIDQAKESPAPQKKRHTSATHAM